MANKAGHAQKWNRYLCCKSHGDSSPFQESDQEGDKNFQEGLCWQAAMIRYGMVNDDRRASNFENLITSALLGRHPSSTKTAGNTIL